MLSKDSSARIRSLSFDFDFVTSVPASVLIHLGKTKVLVTVSLQKGVPSFLKNTGQGWLTAEYSMLPHATEVRSARFNTNGQTNGRSVEISRLIGRVLRAVVDTDFGEQTLHVDCEVLQADGGTRAAAIIAASVALERAQKFFLETKKIRKPFVRERIVAISIGIIDNQIIVDPSFCQDQSLHADFNVVITEKGDLIELHGGAEKRPVPWAMVEKIRDLAKENGKIIFETLQSHGHELVQDNSPNQNSAGDTLAQANNHKPGKHNEKPFGMFSLKNRFQNIDLVTQ